MRSKLHRVFFWSSVVAAILSLLLCFFELGIGNRSGAYSELFWAWLCALGAWLQARQDKACTKSSNCGWCKPKE